MPGSVIFIYIYIDIYIYRYFQGAPCKVPLDASLSQEVPVPFTPARAAPTRSVGGRYPPALGRGGRLSEG